MSMLDWAESEINLFKKDAEKLGSSPKPKQRNDLKSRKRKMTMRTFWLRLSVMMSFIYHRKLKE